MMEIITGPEGIIWKCSNCGFQGPATKWTVEFPTSKEKEEDPYIEAIDHCPRCMIEQHAEYVGEEVG